MVKKIHKIELNNGRLKVRELADMVGISKSAIHRLLTEKRCHDQDNAPIHTMTKTNKLMLELLPHSLYSPDLAPSDYLLFPNLKKWLDGKRLANNGEVESAVTGYFVKLYDSQKHGIEATEHDREKCIDLKEDYDEI
ncbi:PREDICTED: histone-lysine N-methyltransferase SETMAR-like [Nicrophorus vespilloides]|uniref:Histone-lysine N-methyltransferase SETMAR-like n=1 Tax=Nicrophorus vespilloides TaxID=110193 RepID=A0ABM1MPQ0_NICVS|nr:PREDICTED: histone-lysine N-methyltransferase SETMAR-like [Nicrophorus vespilloides]